MDESHQTASSNLGHLNFLHALRTAIAATLAYWLATLFGMPGGYWAAISALVVMQSEVGATLTASRDRFAGTCIGALVGCCLIMLIRHDSIFVFAIGVLVVMGLCNIFHLQNAGRLGGVTVAIIVLIPHSGAAWQIAIERFVEVSLGIVISLGVVLTWTKLGQLIHPET